MADEKKEVSEAELGELFEKAARQGAVLALLHFDAHGPDKKQVEDTLVDFVARLTKERGVLYCKGAVEEAIESEKLYSSCTEVKVLAETYEDLLNIALRYGPIAVEILEPRKEVRLSIEEAQGCLLDASQVAQDYTNYVMEKLMEKGDFEKFQEHLKRRAEFGSHLKNKHGEKAPEEQEKKQA